MACLVAGWRGCASRQVPAVRRPDLTASSSVGTPALVVAEEAILETFGWSQPSVHRGDTPGALGLGTLGDWRPPPAPTALYTGSPTLVATCGRKDVLSACTLSREPSPLGEWEPRSVHLGRGSLSGPLDPGGRPDVARQPANVSGNTRHDCSETAVVVTLMKAR